MRGRFLFTTACGIICVGLLSDSCTGQCDGSADTGNGEALKIKIISAWRQQQSAVDSVSLTLTGSQVVSEVRVKSFQDMRKLENNNDRDATLRDPKASYKSDPFDVHLKLGGSEGWSMIETNRPLFHLEERRFLKNTSETAFDGTIDGARVREMREGFAAIGGAIQPSQEGNLHAHWISLTPLFFSLRGDNPAYVEGDCISRLHVSPDASGADSDLLHLTNDANTLELWLTNAAPFSIRRLLISYRDGRPIAQIQVYETISSELCSIPARWKCTYYSGVPRAVSSREEYTLTSSEFNFPYTRDDFRLKFAPGTVVVRNDKEQRPQQFEVVGDSGTLSSVSQEKAIALLSGQDATLNN